jgi:hypothetical protein
MSDIRNCTFCNFKILEVITNYELLKQYSIQEQHAIKVKLFMPSINHIETNGGEWRYIPMRTRFF